MRVSENREEETRTIEVKTYPEGNANTAVVVHARLDDTLVLDGLLLELLGGGGGVHANVNLGVLDIDALVGEAAEGALEDLEVRGDIALGRGGLDDEVALEADAVDAGAVRPDQVDELGRLDGLDLVELEVEVVVPQLRVGVGLGGELEGEGQEGLADGLVEDRLAPAAVVLEGYVESVTKAQRMIKEI